MHQAFFIIDTFFKRDHSFGSIHSFNIIKLKDDFLGMLGISVP